MTNPVTQCGECVFKISQAQSEEHTKKNFTAQSDEDIIQSTQE